MISSYYFKIKNFDLGLNIDHYPDLLNAAQYKEKHDPSDGEKRVLATLEKLSIKNVEKEYWVNEIMDAVDFYVPDVQKLIEFDGKYHDTNGMTNRLTKLKTFILQNYGYNLIRIDYKEKSTMNDILLRELSFFEPNHTLSRENTIPDKVCGLNAFETFNLGDLNTEKKDKLSEDVYKKWMDEIGCMFKTCSVSQFNSLLIQFSLLVESNGRVKYAFYTYARKDPDFLTMVLTRSLEKADHYSPHELIELLHNWVRLSIKPTKEWRDHWCMLCLKNTKEFNIFNFEATFNYFHILKIDFSDRWVECFFNYTRSLLSTLKVSELCELAHCCVYHRLEIPEFWAAELKHELLLVLPTIKDNTLFELPKLFSIKELKEDYSFLLKWFAQTSLVMKEVESPLLIDTFYQLAKFNIKVTEQWMSNFQERILEMFSALDMADVTRILYGLALMEEKVEKIKPILDACQKYFFNREEAIFQTGNIDVFYNTMRAITYFERSGYKFVINVKNYEEINNIIFTEETLSSLKDTLEVYIKAHYFPNIKRRAKKDFLLKYVDFVDVSHNLVIEIERGNKPAKSHMIDILLRQEGYVCIRLCYHKIKQHGNAYVDEEILNYFKNYNIDFKTVEDMRELKRV
jgi:very-short-patch-repair endonuclease